MHPAHLATIPMHPHLSSINPPPSQQGQEQQQSSRTSMDHVRAHLHTIAHVLGPFPHMRSFELR